MALRQMKPATRGRAARALDVVERIGNRMADPLTVFATFAALVAVASALASWAGVAVVHPGTGKLVVAVNLLTREGIRRMLTEAVRNFVGFPPLGTVLTVMIGVAVAERSGLFASALRGLVAIVPPWAFTATLVFAGVNASAAADAGVIVLPPLGALLFASVGRHPMAGLCAAIAGVGAGFSANVVITSLDPLLAGLTEAAARLVDPSYRVDATANYYFMVVSTFVLTAVGTLVNAWFVEPRFGAWDPRVAGISGALDADQSPAATGGLSTGFELEPLGALERRGLRAAAATVLLFLAILVALVAPRRALLRDAAGGLKPFYDAVVPLVMLSFFLPGLAYGVAARTIRRDRDVARMTADTMASMGTYIVLAFVAGQFVAWFGWSNLGLIVAVKGAGALRALGFTGAPLLAVFVVFTSAINLLIASASAKWAVLATVFVPMFMLLGLSPEVAQAAYRVGDSCTNIVTPLLPYFPLLIVYARRWRPDAGLGTLIAALLPYSIAFLIAWLVLLVGWYLGGAPLGPGAPLHWHPPAGAPVLPPPSAVTR